MEDQYLYIIFLLIGNGGSTFTALSYLDTMYPDDLQYLRVLLIHAGGQSKRMPSSSILGKIFSLIPRGYPLYQMLDVKLAMYLPLLPRIPPGIFVTCADDFLVYNLGDGELKWSFSSTGFTALAHPSTVAIGTSHGVYVLDHPQDVDSDKEIVQCGCIQVLQKPQKEVIYKKEAVLSKKGKSFSDGMHVDGDACYTDSAFFIAMDVARKLICFTKDHGNITCEIDAYGDFLQALGSAATIDYTNNTSNVTTVTDSLLPTRQKIFHLLHGTDLTLLLMNSSRYIHIGTTNEYIEHFCHDHLFQKEMGLSRDVFNLWLQEERDEGFRARKMSHTAAGCVMSSYLPLSSHIPHSSALEYCQFDCPITVGQHCFLSNCSILRTHVEPGGGMKTSIHIPHNLFLQTVPVNVSDQVKYATVCLHIDDNVKKVVQQDQTASLPYLGRTVGDFSNSCNLNLSTLTCHLAKKDEQVSLWNIALFPVCDTMTQSLLQCLDIYREVLKGTHIIHLNNQLMSMDTIMKVKNIPEMLKFRENLFCVIKYS